MNFNWHIVIEHLPALLKGMPLTVQLTILPCAVGLLGGFVLAMMRQSTIKAIRFMAWVYVYFFRGSPLLVQLFLIYYGLSQFTWVQNLPIWEPILKQAYWCAMIAFALNTSAYVSEIIRGAMGAVPKGELEAADALGMNFMQKLVRIRLPRAFAMMIPAYSNEIIFMLKGSALASTISLMDITGTARTIAARTYTHMELLTTAGILYLLLSWLLMGGFRLLENRYNRHKLAPNAGI